MRRKTLAMVCLAIAVIASLVLLGITLTGLKNDEVPQERFRRYCPCSEYPSAAVGRSYTMPILEVIGGTYLIASIALLLPVLVYHGFPFLHDKPSTWRDVMLLIVFLPWWILMAISVVFVFWPGVTIWKWLNKPLRKMKS